MPEPESARLIYTLGRPIAYRVVTLVLVVHAMVLGWLALSRRSEDMIAEFGSMAVWRIVQIGLLVFGLSVLAAWLWFKGRYVRRIAWLEASGQVELERSGTIVGSRIHRLIPADFSAATTHEGRADLIAAPRVHAPYRRLRIRGLPPLILDDQGTVHDQRALDRILAGRPPDAGTRIA